MSKKKAPALHERRGREDISTRPPRLAGCPIKLAGKTRLRRLSLAADSCVNRKYYGGDPGVGQRKPGLHTIPPSGTLRRRPGARFSLGQVLARTKSTFSALRLVRNLRKREPLRRGWLSCSRALKKKTPHRQGLQSKRSYLKCVRRRRLSTGSDAWQRNRSAAEAA